MKLSFSVQATLISGNATQLHLEHKSLNTPLITHNTTVHHTHWKSIGTHHDGSWDVYPGSKGHKHLWFWPREHRLWMKPAGRPLLVSHSFHFQKIQGLERLCFELCGELCVTVSRAYILMYENLTATGNNHSKHRKSTVVLKVLQCHSTWWGQVHVNLWSQVYNADIFTITVPNYSNIVCEVVLLNWCCLTPQDMSRSLLPFGGIDNSVSRVLFCSLKLMWLSHI